MKKQGFTLAEVLITLGIIGVVAAITLPGLNSNVNNRRIGPTLAKAINNLENANRMALVENGAVNLNDISSIRGVSGKPSYSQILASRLSGDIVSDGGATGTTIYKGRDGITYKINNSLSGEKKPNLPEQYHGQHYQVTIDINGDKGPNTGGTDQFLVFSDLRGAVIPAGSELSETITGWTTIYKVYGDCNKNGVTPNSYCTNTVINDGWTVNYL